MKKKTSRSTRTVQRTANIAGMFSQLIEVGSNKAGEMILASMIQLISNCLDAMAKGIQITIEPKAGIFRIQDDGHGFDDEGVSAFLSIMKEHKKDRHDLRGQHGSGRILTFKFTQKLVVYSYVSEAEGFYTFSLTLQDLIDTVNGNVAGELEPCKKPEGWLLPKGKSGSLIVLEGVDWDLLPKRSPEKTLIKKLGYCLSPEAAKSISVNGQPLDLPPTEGKDVYYFDGNVEKVGNCTCHLYPRKAVGSQRVQVGGFDPHMPLDDFIALLPSDIREILSHNNPLSKAGMSGVILVHWLNAYRAPDNTLRLEFVSDPRLLATITWILEIQSHFSERVEKDVSKELILLEQCSKISKSFGGTKPAPGFEDGYETKTPKKDEIDPAEKLIIPDQKRYDVYVNQVIELGIREYTVTGQIGWQVQEGDGILSKDRGTTNVFTAPAEEQLVRVMVYDTRKKNVCSIILINVLAEDGDNLQITPAYIEVDQGDHFSVSIRNSDLWQGQEIHWGFNPDVFLSARGGRIRQTLLVNKGAKPGEYLVQAMTEDGKQSAQATILVKDGDNAGESKVKLLEQEFEVRFAHLSGPLSAEFSPEFKGSEKVFVLFIDPNHRRLNGVKGLEIVREDIVRAYVIMKSIEEFIGSPTDYEVAVEEILEKIEG